MFITRYKEGKIADDTELSGGIILLSTLLSFLSLFSVFFSLRERKKEKVTVMLIRLYVQFCLIQIALKNKNNKM